MLPHTSRLNRWPGAQVAQLVEHATENRSVTGSIPVLGTIFLEIDNDQVVEQKLFGLFRLSCAEHLL